MMTMTVPFSLKQKRDTLERLMETHETELLRHATGLTGNPDAAQQVVQTVFMSLAGAWHNGSKPSPNIRYWLYRETFQRAIGSLLNRKQVQTTKKPSATNTAREHVWDGLHRLLPREKEVILLRFQEGFSTAEIAVITGHSKSEVYRLLDSAIRKLAHQLKGGKSS